MVYAQAREFDCQRDDDNYEVNILMSDVCTVYR